MAPTKDEQIFIDALRELNVTSRQAEELSLQPAPRNPLKLLILDHVSSERKFAFGKLFDLLLARGQINWDNLRHSFADLTVEILAQELDRDYAKTTTEPLLGAIAIAYCGEFKHTHLLDRLLPDLDCAHRGPTLCASRIIARSGSVQAILTDEWLTAAPSALSEDVSILYLCTHGRVVNAQYQAALHASFWQPSPSDFGKDGPKVLVLDTCHGADRTPPYQNFWSGVLQGKSIRLLLACDGPIVMDRLSTKRGYAFGDNLSHPNTSIADAWLRAVRSTSTTGTSRPVAIGLGDTDSDAKAMLALTFDNLCSPNKRPFALSCNGPIYFADRH